MEKKDYDLANRLLVKRLQTMPADSEDYKQAQTDLVVLNQPLIIRFLKNKVVSENDKEDAVQVCRMSLLKAATTYDISGNNKYSTYAMNTMMFDFATFSKDYDSNPSGYYLANKLLYKANKRLIEKGIENPSIEQISKEMKSERHTVVSVMQMKGVYSTETPISSSEASEGVTILDTLESADNVVEEVIKIENSEHLRKAISFLSKEEAYIVEAKSFSLLKNEEICDVLGVSRQTLIKKLNTAYSELKNILTSTWKFNAHVLKQDLLKEHNSYLQENGEEPNIKELIKNKNITYDKLYEVFMLCKTDYMNEVMPQSYNEGIFVKIDAKAVVNNVSNNESKSLIHKFILQDNMKKYAEENSVTSYILNKTIQETLANFKMKNDSIFIKSIISQRNK